MRARQPLRSVKENVLQALKQQGVESTVLDCRLAYADAAQILHHYFLPMQGANRIFPDMLPTQASGRWSTSNPPVVNFPKDCLNPECPRPGAHMAEFETCWSARDVIVPDQGTYWVEFDYDAIEAKLVAAYSGDEADLEAFAHNFDVHTLTACSMFGLPVPPLKTKALHTDPSCEGWRQAVGWEGESDRRRHLAKTCRYALSYGVDKRSVLNARGVEELGLTRQQLEEAAEAYLRSKPALVAWKRRTWGEAIETGETRTFQGRRRKLFVTSDEKRRWWQAKIPGDAAREGLNHQIQGAVAGIMDRTLIAICHPETGRWPSSRLVVNKHDGADICFPASVEPWPDIREIAEREWDVDGHLVSFRASWKKVFPDGHKETLR